MNAEQRQYDDRDEDAAASAEQEITQPSSSDGQASAGQPGSFGSAETYGQQRQYHPIDDQFARNTPETDAHGENSLLKDDPAAQPPGGQTSEYTENQPIGGPNQKEERA